jgi:RNA polymerase sigma factor (TIGR02999 family)
MTSGDITQLLLDIRTGRSDARDRLLGEVYEQLRGMAHRRLTGGAQTLSTTDLVHEVYLKLFDRSRLEISDRRHFFAVAAMAMRQIVIDHARRRQARKRGGGLQRLDLESPDVSVEDHTEELLSLDVALRRLSEMDERLGRVVELRFFGGFTVEETAEVLDVDPRTIKRDWRKARALLYSELGGSAAG